MDLSTMLASWRAGSLRQQVTPALLGALERSFKTKQERLLAYGGPSSAQERAELNELRTGFRRDWNRMQREISEQLDDEVERLRRAANPPADDATVSRMASLAPVYVPKWERSPGNLQRDAERFEESGDLAGLALAAEHAGLLKDPQHRTAFVQGVNEVRDLYATNEQRQARQRAGQLEADRDQFEQGTALRRLNIAAMTKEMGPPPADGQQVPMSATARPRR